MRNKILEIFILGCASLAIAPVFAGGGGGGCPGAIGSAADIETCKAFTLLSGTTAASSCSPAGGPYTSCNIKYNSSSSTEDNRTPIVRTGTASMAATVANVTVTLSGTGNTYTQTTNGVAYNSTISFPTLPASKTAVFFSYNASDNAPNNALVYMTRTESGGDLTSIKFIRGATAGTISIRYWVVYFPTGVTVRAGTFVLGANQATATTGSCASACGTLTWTQGSATFDASKSFMTFAWRTDSGAALNNNNMVKGSITSNVVTFSRTLTTSSQVLTGNFQIITMDRASAQHFSISVAASSTSQASSSLSPALASARSILLASCSYNGAGSLNDKTITITPTTDASSNITSITITRAGTANTLTCEATVFQFPLVRVDLAPRINNNDTAATAVDVVRRNSISIINNASSGTGSLTTPFRQTSVIIPMTHFPLNDSSGNSNLSNTLTLLESSTFSQAFDRILGTRAGTANATTAQYNLITFGAIGRVIPAQ